MKPYFHTPNASSFLFLAWLAISFTCIEHLLLGSANALEPIKPASQEEFKRFKDWDSPENVEARAKKLQQDIAEQRQKDADAQNEINKAAKIASSNKQDSSSSGQGSVSERDVTDFEVKDNYSFTSFVDPKTNGDNPPPIKTPVKLALQDIASFSCSESESATAAKTKSSNNAPVIRWKSTFFKDFSPKTRCAQVSARFEEYRKKLVAGETLFITSGKLNKLPVICLTTQEKVGCEEGKLPNNGLLFTLAPTEEAIATQLVEKLGTLLADIREGKPSAQPLVS